MWRSYRWMPYVHLPEHRSLNDCSLYFRFIIVLALPRFYIVPEYLPHRSAKHFYYVVLRNILWRMLEKNEVVFIACNYGPVG
jgi:hypothetical protein